MLLSLAAGARRVFVEARDTKKAPGRSGGLARYLWVRRRSYRRPTVFASRHHQFMRELLSLDIMVAAPFGQSRVRSRATLRRTIAQQSAPRGIFPARFEAPHEARFRARFGRCRIFGRVPDTVNVFGRIRTQPTSSGEILPSGRLGTSRCRPKTRAVSKNRPRTQTASRCRPKTRAVSEARPAAHAASRFRSATRGMRCACAATLGNQRGGSRTRQR